MGLQRKQEKIVFDIGDIVSSTFPPYLSNRKIVSINANHTPILYFIVGFEASPPLARTVHSLKLIRKAPKIKDVDTLLKEQRERVLRSAFE